MPGLQAADFRLREFFLRSLASLTQSKLLEPGAWSPKPEAGH